MIYIIDNHYADNHSENCIIIENNNFTIEEMTTIVGSLGNYYLRCTKQSFCPPEKLVDVLCDKFQCKDKKTIYIEEMDFIERRVYSPMLHMAYIMRGNIVVWMDIQEAMDYCINKMWSVLNEYLNQDELMEIEKKWVI